MTSLLGRTMGKIPDPPSRAGVAVAFTGALVAAIGAIAVLVPVVVMIWGQLEALGATS